jgi:hypothetical protein
LGRYTADRGFESAETAEIEWACILMHVRTRLIIDAGLLERARELTVRLDSALPATVLYLYRAMSLNGIQDRRCAGRLSPVPLSLQDRDGR